MKRRLFLLSGSTAATLILPGCGGGGEGADLRGGAELTDGPAAAPAAAPAPAPAMAPANAPHAPAPEAAPTDQAGPLPAKMLGCYYTTWDTGRFKITDVPLDFNLIFLFHSKPNGTPINGNWNNVGNGSFYFEHYHDVPVESIQACRRRGQKVILTVGGAHAGYAWDNRTKSRNFVESFKSMYARLGGVDGIDFNNYEATILHGGNLAAVTAEMIWIAGELKSLYGRNFAVMSPPQPSAPEQQHLMAEMARAGVLDVAGPQHYDWVGFNAPGYIKGRIDIWNRLIGADKTMVGLSANYSNGPSLQDCIREWDAIKAAYPNIRGMFCWSAQTNLAGGNLWGRTMKARM
jgi:chitinase